MASTDVEKSGKKRTGPIEFFKQVRQEMGRVTWPTRKETVISTIMVFVMVVIASVFLFFVDQIISFLIQIIL